MDELSDLFILSSDETNDDLFDDSIDTEESKDSSKEKEISNKETTEEPINSDELFDNPESVGSEDNNNKEKEKDTSSPEDGTSPNQVFYSSIASALRDEGILPDLDDDTITKIVSPEDFAEAIEKQIQAKLSEREQRISEALNYGVENSVVKQFENTLQFLDSINDDVLNEESEKGEELRKKLIYQDFINRGYSKERATREVNKSFSAGSDLEDAKEALLSNKEYFNEQYNSIIEESKKERLEQQNRVKEEASKLKKSMLEDKEIFKGIELDKTTRQKAYDNITKPVYKTDKGDYLTAIQKYELENPVEFRKYLSILFTMTNGFSSLDNIVNNKVKREVKNSLRELEHKLNNSAKLGGTPTYVGFGSKDSYIGKGWKVDI